MSSNVYLHTLPKQRRFQATEFKQQGILECAVPICLIFGEISVAVDWKHDSKDDAEKRND